jgi:hypothetical protein
VGPKHVILVILSELGIATYIWHFSILKLASQLMSFTLLKFHQFYCEGDFAPPIRMGLGFPLKKKAFEQP